MTAVTKEIAVIDFGKLGGPVFVGRDNGQRSRASLNVAQMDQEGTHVRVTIPADTYAVNSSFFLGLFGESIVRLGSDKAFFAHYQFDAPEQIKVEIDSIVDRALTEQGYLKIK